MWGRGKSGGEWRVEDEEQWRYTSQSSAARASYHSTIVTGVFWTRDVGAGPTLAMFANTCDNVTLYYVLSTVTSRIVCRDKIFSTNCDLIHRVHESEMQWDGSRSKSMIVTTIF